MSEDPHDKALRQQLRMAPATWRALQAHGVTETTPLVIDLFWYSATDEAARGLAAVLAERGFTSPSVGQSQGQAAVKAQFGPRTFSLDDLLRLVKEMSELGFAHGCEFDGWGAQVPDPPAKPKPWWKPW